MARRSPAVVRAGLPRRARSGTKFSVVSGVPEGATAEIQRVEALRLWPGAVGEALVRWAGVVYLPGRIDRVIEAAQYHGCPCCDPSEPRDVLEQALAALTPGSRRALLSRVEPLDEVFLRRTVQNPHAPGDWPWWWRRC